VQPFSVFEHYIILLLNILQWNWCNYAETNRWKKVQVRSNYKSHHNTYRISKGVGSTSVIQNAYNFDSVK